MRMKRTAAPLATERRGMMAEYYGIDVSLYQKGFDFKAAVSEGVKFAVIKASESTFADPEFESHYKSAGKAGLYRGAYHYLTATSVADARAQADFFLKTVAGKQFEYPLFVDVEDSTLANLSKTFATDVVRAFCERVESAGYWCGFYCNYYFYTRVLNGDSLAKRFSLWLASWTESAPFACQMWQFGGEINLKKSNRVANVVCDQDYSYMDYPALISAKGLNGFKSTPSGLIMPDKEVKGQSSTVSSPSEKTGEKASQNGSKEADKTVVKSDGNTPRVGDVVRLKSSAVIWNTNDKFASWVYSSDLYLRELSGKRAVVSTQKTGVVTGAVDVGMLTVVKR